MARDVKLYNEIILLIVSVVDMISLCTLNVSVSVTGADGCELYNEIIQHETPRVALYDMLEGMCDWSLKYQKSYSLSHTQIQAILICFYCTLHASN